MRQLAPFLSPLCVLLASCAATPATSDEDVTGNSVSDDAPTEVYQAAQADGHLQSEHVEVSPGVFLLQSVVDAGDVQYVETDVPTSPEDAEARMSAKSKKAQSCVKYDQDYYSDNTRAGAQFGGKTYWYGYALAEDYHYDGHPDYDWTGVQAYAYTYAEKKVDYLYAMTYVRLNGKYVGYTYKTAKNNAYVYSYGTWESSCKGGSLSIDAMTYHYWQDGGAGGDSQSITSNVSASTACCPVEM